MLYQLMLVESMLIKETNARWYVGVDDRICHQKSVIKAKNVSKYTSNWEDARVIIACYYFEAKSKV